jgi:hypothetical protein
MEEVARHKIESKVEAKVEKRVLEAEHETIIISHERVPVLIQWLQETMEERRKMSDSDFEK